MRVTHSIVLGSAVICLPAFGADYYVAADGSDSASGTFSSPWKTIQKAADTMAGGDTCWIRGGTYRETVTPADSGSEDSLITFSAYADEEVIINGCEPVDSAWTVDEGSVYKAAVSMDLGHENQVFINESNMVWEARWPDVGTTAMSGLLEYDMAAMESGTSSTNIICSSIPDYDWTGGSAWVSSGSRWFSWTGELTGYGSGEVSVVNNADSGDKMACEEDGKFYLFGVRDALDSANEWYYDETAGELYLWAPDGLEPADVEVKTRQYGFDLSDRQYIRLENLNFHAAGIKTSSGSANLEMDGLVMKYIYHSTQAENQYTSQLDTGLVLYGTDHLLENSEIAYSSGTGVYLGGSGHRIINNYIHDHDYLGSYASPMYVNGTDFIVSHNTISRAGRQVIYFSKLMGSIFQYNDISWGGYLTWDLGLVYGNGIEGGNAEVRYNWFHDNLSPTYGKGIYYDHGCRNIITHHNAVWGVTSKALNNNQYANYLLWYNNTGSTTDDAGMGSIWGAGMKKELHGCRYVNNVLNADVEFDASDYTLENNVLNYSGIVSNLYLTVGTEPVDAAVELEGITDSWEGDGPDCGAYELGGENWTAGHDFDSPPVSIDTTRSLPRHRNLLGNPSFERATLEPWESMEGNTALNYEAMTSQWDADNTTLMGDYSVELGSGQSGISQVITNLEPNTEYEFMGKFRVDAGETAYLGVRNYGGDELTGTEVSDTITDATANRSGASPDEWAISTLNFRTGADATSAEVYAWKSSTGSGTVYFEDAGVQLAELEYIDDGFDDGLDGWTVVDDVTASASAQSPVGGGQGALLVDDESTISSMEREISVSGNDVIYIQFDFLFTGDVNNPGFQLLNGTSKGINLHLATADGPVQYKDGDTWITLDTTPAADTWYRYTLTVQPSATADDQFDLRIQSLVSEDLDVTYTGMGFQEDLDSFGSVLFHYNVVESVAGGEFCIDNVLVTTSEDELDYSVVEEASTSDSVLIENDFGILDDVGPAFGEVQEGTTGGSTDTSTGSITTGAKANSHYGLSSESSVDAAAVDGSTGFTIDWTVSSCSASPRYNGCFFGVTDTAGNAPWAGAIDAVGVRITDSLGAIEFVENDAGTQTTHSLGVDAPYASSLSDGFSISITVNDDDTWSASSSGLSSEFNTNGVLSALTYSDLASSLAAYTSMQGESQSYTVDHVTLSAVVPDSDAFELSLTNGTTMVWVTSEVITYEIQSRSNLLSGSWTFYTNLISTPPTTSFELPVDESGQLFFRVVEP